MDINKKQKSNLGGDQAHEGNTEKDKVTGVHITNPEKTKQTPLRGATANKGNTSGSRSENSAKNNKAKPKTSGA